MLDPHLRSACAAGAAATGGSIEPELGELPTPIRRQSSGIGSAQLMRFDGGFWADLRPMPFPDAAFQGDYCQIV